MSDDGYRYCYTAEDGELVEKRKIADHEVLGMVHYPNDNVILVYSQKGEITIWRTCVCLFCSSHLNVLMRSQISLQDYEEKTTLNTVKETPFKTITNTPHFNAKKGCLSAS